jgi:hypothetical protein
MTALIVNEKTICKEKVKTDEVSELINTFAHRADIWMTA